MSLSPYAMDYCFLTIRDCLIDSPEDLLRMIVTSCDQRGVAVILPSDSFLKERGYWDEDGMFFKDGLAISLGDFYLGTAEKPDPEDHSQPSYLIPVAFQGEIGLQGSVTAGGLAGQGLGYALELKDGRWEIRDSGMAWIA